MRKILLVLLLLSSTAHADVSAPLNVTEEDGSPSVYPYSVKFANGSLTDNGDGTVSVASGGGAGDITSVGLCTSGACFDGTQVTNTTAGSDVIGIDEEYILRPSASNSGHYAIGHYTDIRTQAGDTNHPGFIYGQYDYIYHAASVAIPTLTGIQEYVINDSPNAVTTVRAGQFNSSTTAAGGATSLDGIYAAADTTGSGSVTNLRGLIFAGSHQSTGTITDAYNIYLTGFFKGVGAGTITNLYGLYIAAQTVGTNSYNIYSAGATTNNVLEGALDVGGIINAGSGNINITNSTGNLDGTKVANADLGDISVSSGVWSVDDNSIALGVKTTGNYAAGDAEAGAALSGDTATAFFSTGTLEDARLPTSMADKSMTGNFNVPNGSNPTVDAAGEVAVDTSTTSGSMLRFYGDASYQVPGYYSKSFVITGATASGDFGTIWKTPWNITIRKVSVVATGGTNVVGQLDECDADGANCSTVDSSDITATAGTNANDDGTLSNATIDANDWVGWHTTSVSGTNTRVAITFNYTVDAVN